MELDPRFKIRAPLRCEGIGRLDCAEDLESGMRMAVRWLPLEANGSAAVQACEQLPEHPTLPRIRQIGQVGASAYVAMEFPDGNLLATQLHEPLPAAALIGITAQIADALATIHSQDVFHGEMSADSVLLVGAPGERAYLWDMPLVIANRLTDRRGEDRLMYQLVKAAPYLAPERARGAKASAEADVYALGAIVCIAGGASLPLAESTLAVVHSVAMGTWVPRVPKAIPEPLRSMLERMVARDPSARPTAREVAELFMPPVAAHRTEPEMPAIVFPVAAVIAPVAASPAAVPVLISPLLIPPPVLFPAAAPTAPGAPVQTPVAADGQDHPAPEAKLELPAAPVVAKPESAVQLTDNVSVSQDLANAGAVLLTAEEAALLPTRNRKVPLMIAGVMAVLVMVLGGLAIDLSRQGPEVQAPAPARAPVVAKRAQAPGPAQVLAAPAAVEASSDDELAALTPRAKRPAAKKRAAKAEVAAQDSAAPAVTEQKQDDFGFLEEDQDLKRPTF
ncbi:MAG: putative serine/threonine protein kinase [Myxococcaceae bacterium]|nr:putative serine/threonine protein kinase [Myxococcaceae bacterium]